MAIDIRTFTTVAEKLIAEGTKLIQTATLYDAGTVKSADVVEAIDSTTRALAFWKEKLTATPTYPSKERKG